MRLPGDRPDGTIVRVNQTFLRLDRLRARRPRRRARFADLLTGGGRIYHETHCAPLLRMQGAVREIAARHRAAPTARRLPALVNAVVERDADGEPLRSARRSSTRRPAALRARAAAARATASGRRASTPSGCSGSARARRRGRHRAVARAVVERSSPPSPPARTRRRVRDDGRRAAAAVGRRRRPSRACRARRLRARARPGRWRGSRSASRRAPGSCGSHSTSRARSRRASARCSSPCAGQATLALERARLYEQQRDVAHGCQQSMLGGAPARDPRFESRRSTSRRRAARGRRRLVRRVPVAGRARRARGRRRRRPRARRGERDGPAAQRHARARRRRAGPGRGARPLDTFVEQVPAAPLRHARLRGDRPGPGESVRLRGPSAAPARGAPRPRRGCSGGALAAARRALPGSPRAEAVATLAGDGACCSTPTGCRAPRRARRRGARPARRRRAGRSRPGRVPRRAGALGAGGAPGRRGGPRRCLPARVPPGRLRRSAWAPRCGARPSTAPQRRRARAGTSAGDSATPVRPTRTAPVASNAAPSASKSVSSSGSTSSQVTHSRPAGVTTAAPLPACRGCATRCSARCIDVL